MLHFKLTVIILLYKGRFNLIYRSIPGKRPLPGKHPRTSFQGVNVADTIQIYGNYIPGKCPCGPKSGYMFKCPWALTRDTMAYIIP